MKQKVVVFSQIDSQILTRLSEQFELLQVNPKQGDVNQQIRDMVADADGMIGAGRLLNEDNLKTAKKLKIISSVSVGYDNYDLKYLKQQGICLTHTPHVLTETTADLAFTLLLSAARQVPKLDAWVKAGQWKRTVSHAHFGQDVFGKTIGIVGMGNIGAAIARRAFHGFNMSVLYHSRSEYPIIAQSVNAEYCGLNDLLQRADFVVLAVDLNPSSQALIAKPQLDLMKPTAVLVNIARGAVLDEQALVQAIREGKIFAAGLDVYQHEPLAQSELFELDQVVTLPHIGSATEETRFKMAELAYQNLVLGLAGKQPNFVVDHVE